MSRSSRKSADIPYNYTRLGAQVQNVKRNNVYVFGEGDVCDDEVVEFEMDNVRSRKANSNAVKNEGPAFVERQIAEDDTLQSLALQYGLPVRTVFYAVKCIIYHNVLSVMFFLYQLCICSVH